MRARRSDYALLNRPPDIPYQSFDSRLQSKIRLLDRTLLTPLEERSENNFAKNPGASFSHIDRGPSGTVGNVPLSYRSTPSGLDRGHDLADNFYGASDRISSSHSSAEWKIGVPAKQFAFAATTERGPTVPLERKPPIFAAGEPSISQSFDASLSKSGLWPSLERTSSGDAGIAGYGGIAPPPLLRQSSGGSFTDSLLSSDVTLSNLSATVSLSTNESTLLGGCYEEASKEDGTKLIRSYDRSSRSWAQQTEQSYNLQLALALRLVATAELTEEPLLSANCKENRVSSSPARSSVGATALRFWVNGSLGYSDKIQDGFYHIWGMNPHVWAICNDASEGGHLPSLDTLRQVDPSESSMEVVLFDKHGDSHLRDLENQALGLAGKATALNGLAESLGELVCDLMGGASSLEDGEMMSRWRASSSRLKDCFSCVVLPVGSLSAGLCRHRALLYKALADCIDLPCRITRGCKYCGLSDGATCLVLCGGEREFLVDLIGKPGALSNPDSFLKSLHSPPIASPLRLPELKVSEVAGKDGSQRRKSRSEFKKVEADPVIMQPGSREINRSMLDKLGATPSFNGPASARLGSVWPVIATSEGERTSSSFRMMTTSLRADPMVGRERLSNDGRKPSRNLASIAVGSPAATDSYIPQKNSLRGNLVSVKLGNTDSEVMPQQPALQAENLAGLGASLIDSSTEVDMIEEKTVEVAEEQGGNVVQAKSLELSLALDGLEIPWEDLDLRERIGAGSFGTVHRADWQGSDVAVKILIDQDFQEERLQEFVREVALMKRMRHPNVVLFMGAVTKRPNFSIVTEYLPRGSLFRLLHRAGVREMLDERRRIRMALDVAKGMNYLHRLNPPIVHRDLKSPNLLVDKTWTVKVCDFGLSRFKGNTFLSSRSAAGTPEWMAPEVLRDELSNEKSDVYSFGVILWELATLQQPWSGLSPAQVVGAVGFQNRRLQIPIDVNPEIAAIIEACFSNDPRLRPSFASIMESLKSVQKSSVTPGGAIAA